MPPSNSENFQISLTIRPFAKVGGGGGVWWWWGDSLVGTKSTSLTIELLLYWGGNSILGNLGGGIVKVIRFFVRPAQFTPVPPWNPPGRGDSSRDPIFRTPSTVHAGSAWEGG